MIKREGKLRIQSKVLRVAVGVASRGGGGRKAAALLGPSRPLSCTGGATAKFASPTEQQWRRRRGGGRVVVPRGMSQGPPGLVSHKAR